MSTNHFSSSLLRTAIIRCRVLLALFCAAGLSLFQASGAILSWSGGSATTANWNDSANWGFAGVPANGDTLIFSAGQPRQANTNNIASLTLNQIRFVGAGGGYALYGNAFTLTSSIEATNTAGANTVNNNIALSGATIPVNVTVNLTLFGVLSGSVGLTKNGAGTLQLAGPLSNTYGGTTTVNAGILELAKSGFPFATAIAGDLSIGGGVVSATVRNLVNLEIADTANLTIGQNGLWDLNGWNETIGSNLTLSGGGSVQVGTGTMGLTAPGTVTVSSGNCNLNGTGNIQLGVGPCNFNIVGNLNVFPALLGSAAITKTGQGVLNFYGPNAYSGLTTVSSGWLWAHHSSALGATNSGTIVSNGATLVLAGNIGITNESLTLNGPGEPFWAALDCESLETNIWAGPITLNADSTFGNYGGGTLRLIGPIDGAGGVNEIAGGTLTFEGTNANSYAGTTTVSTGTLLLGKTGVIAGAIPHALVLQDGTVARNLANYQMWGFGKAVTINTSALLDLAGFTDSVGLLTLNGGQITTGTGQVWLLEDITVLGNTTAMSQINGAAYLYSSDITISNSGHNFSPDLRINATVTSGGPYGFIKNGNPGEVSLAASNAFTGPVTVNAGNLWIENNNSLGNITSNATVNAGGSLFLYGSPAVGAKPLIVNGGTVIANFGNSSWAGNITLASNGTFNLPGPAFGLTLSGVIGGPGALTKIGAGTLTFSGASANTYTNTTLVRAGKLVLNKATTDGSIQGALIIGDDSGGVNADVVQLVGGAQLSYFTAVTVTSSGLFDVNGVGEAFASLAGSGNVTLGAGGGIGVGYDNTSPTFSGVISGSGSVYKEAGSGTQTFSGNNTYTGTTYDLAGALVINGFQPQSPVSVSSSATLGGSGTVGDISASGTISPGNSAGILTSSNVTFTSSGHYRVELNGASPGVDYDQLNVRGTINLASAVLNLGTPFSSPGSPVHVGDQLRIINNDGVEPITGTFLGWPNGSSYTAPGVTLQISYAGGDGNDVVFIVTAVNAAAVTNSLTAGNGDHLLSPNECNNLYIVITNTSGSTMSGVTATLSTTNPAAIVTQPNSAYPNVPSSGKATNATAFQISTLPGFVCGTDLILDLSISSPTHGTIAFPVVLHSGSVGAPSRYDVSITMNIPDVGTIESTNFVGGFAGVLNKIAVSVFLTHPFDSDLDLSLVAPDGTVVPLSLTNGSGANFGTACSPDSNRTTFDDSAATAITTGSSPFVGTFRPQGSLATALASPPNGMWRLRVKDNVGGSFGALRCWSLFLYPAACVPGTGFCDTCPGTVTNSITVGDLVQSDRLVRNGYDFRSLCGAATFCPGPINFDGPYHYKTHNFTNAGGPACITVYLNNPCGTLFASAYVGSYDPLNICNNYLGDIGDGVASGFFSFTVPAATNFIVVVNEVPLLGSPCDYAVVVTGAPCPPPQLQIAPVPVNRARLFWPTTAGGYLLESAPSLLTPATWTGVPDEPIISGGKYNVTNNITGTNKFYRLHKP